VIPLLTSLTLYLNKKLLDKEIKEGKSDDPAMRQQIADLLKDLPPIPESETMDAGDKDEDEEEIVDNGEDMDED